MTVGLSLPPPLTRVIQKLSVAILPIIIKHLGSLPSVVIVFTWNEISFWLLKVFYNFLSTSFVLWLCCWNVYAGDEWARGCEGGGWPATNVHCLELVLPVGASTAIGNTTSNISSDWRTPTNFFHILRELIFLYFQYPLVTLTLLSSQVGLG